MKRFKSCSNEGLCPHTIADNQEKAKTWVGSFLKSSSSEALGQFYPDWYKVSLGEGIQDYSYEGSCPVQEGDN